MDKTQLIFSIASAIILFLFGLSGFTAELKTTAGEKLEVIMRKLTANRFIAFFVGLILTATIQSSTAVSTLAVSLVESSVLSFSGAVAIMLGSYIGTTTTAWLVSFKLTSIGPYFIVVGSLMNLIPHRIKIFGKALFYFGFIFFSLDLINTAVGPLKESSEITELLLHTENPFMGVLIGVFLTIILQSSTVVTGLAIIFLQQGLITPHASIPIVLGANIGTTFTALVAAIKMGDNARKSAVANTLINTIGVVMVLPFLGPFSEWVMRLSPNEDMVVATAHLFFNLVLVTVFLTALDPFIKGMNYLFRKKDE